MTLTQKETSLIKDLRSQEQLCVEKYAKYASEACDGQLKNLFMSIGQVEQGHIQTLDQIAGGIVPQMDNGAQKPASPPFSGGNATQSCDEKKKDAYLCSDALATEKHVSATYNTCIFEFSDPSVRNALNHIQKEEQEHGEKIYSYMSKNGMYNN